MVLIVYFILMANGWRFEAIDDSPNSTYYCEWLKKNLADHYDGKIGDMKIICIEDKGEDL